MNAEKELKAISAQEFTKNNGLVMRVLLTFHPTGWFKINDLINMLSAYNLSIDDILGAVGYFEDMGYIKVREADSKEKTSICDSEWIDVELRLFGVGKQAARGIIEDEGISL